MVDYATTERVIARPRARAREASILRNLDWALLLAVAALVGYGLWAIAGITKHDQSNPNYYVTRQAVYALIGVVGMVAFIFLEPAFWRRHAKVVYGLVIAVLVVAPVFGAEVRHTRRWIDIGPFRFQPSEFGKLLLVLFLAAFLADQDSMFLATASADGQPYIQHRGGPKGFIKVLDKNTLAFADYSGNRQYITQGNLSENPKTNIFLMDYAHRRRVKIWGEARVVDDDPALMKSLMPKGYKARPEQVIVFTVSAWDTNCPQHIPQKFDAPDVAAALAARDARIAELEAELAAMRGEASSPGRAV